MAVNKAIGECSAEYDGIEYIIRPSFRALKQIDDLEDSIKSVCNAYNAMLAGVAVTVEQISICAYVLQCCSDLPDDMVGWSEYMSNKFKWRKKVLSINEIVIMAHHCIKWGVFGDPKPLTRMAKKQQEERLKNEPQRDFDPMEFVSVLIDEFHLSSSDAWDSTMVEFQRLCDHRERKYRADKPEPITDDERDYVLNHYRAAMKRKQELNNNG